MMDLQALAGQPDPRGMQGILARGKPTYMGSNAPQGAGRPPNAAMQMQPQIQGQLGGLGFDLNTVKTALMQRMGQ